MSELLYFGKVVLVAFSITVGILVVVGLSLLAYYLVNKDW